jgi:hypothetical protein
MRRQYLEAGENFGDNVVEKKQREENCLEKDISIARH